jgi:hypothetical protein
MESFHGADILKGLTAATAEVDLMAGKNACRQWMLGGDMANASITCNSHGMFLENYF